VAALRITAKFLYKYIVILHLQSDFIYKFFLFYSIDNKKKKKKKKKMNAKGMFNFP
jgi:hypothetical protein